MTTPYQAHPESRRELEDSFETLIIISQAKVWTLQSIIAESQVLDTEDKAVENCAQPESRKNG